MSSSVEEVLAAARAADLALVGEVCGYLILGAADAVLETGARPAPESVRIHDDGQVEVSGERTSDALAERALRELLGLLLAAVRTPFPNLSRVASRPEARGIASLVTELEAALVPVNRRAARRSLSRLSREARRAVERGLIVPRVSLSPGEDPDTDAVTPGIVPVFEVPVPPELEAPGAGPGGELEVAPDTQRFSPEVDPFDDEPTVVVAAVSDSLTDLVAELVASSRRAETPEPIDPFDLSIDVDFGPDEEPKDLASPGSLWPELVRRHPVAPQLDDSDLTPRDASPAGPPGFQPPPPVPVAPEALPTDTSPRPASPSLRPASDRYRTVRPRSDVPPKNPTPLLPPSNGPSARPSDLEGLLLSMKPRSQPDQLQQALEGLSRGETRRGEG